MDETCFHGCYSTISLGHNIKVILADGCSSAYSCTGSMEKFFMWPRSNAAKLVDAIWLSTYMSADDSYIIFGAGAATYYPASLYINSWVAMDQRPVL